MTVMQPLKRVQILLPSETYLILQRLASEEKQSVSALVRRAVEDQIVKEARLAQKAEALARLAAMDLPVEDWEIMEVEIMEGRYRVMHDVVRWSPEAFVQEMSQRRKTPTT